MYISIQEAKNIVQKNGFIVKDVSGYNSYGYAFAIFKAETGTAPIYHTYAVGEALVVSELVYFPETVNARRGLGAWRAMFNRESVEALFARN